MAQSILDVVAGQAEKVEQAVQKLVASGNTISDRVVKATGFEIQGNRRAVRVPVITTRPMTGYKTNLNGGTFGRGRDIQSTAYFLGHLPFGYSFEITLETLKMNSDNAIDASGEILGQSATVASEWQDVMFHQPGDGILAGRYGGSTTATVVISSANFTTYTFADAADDLGVSMLVEGMQVEAYSSDLDTRRVPASGSELTYIAAIDWNTKTVRLSQELASAAAGDVLAIAGLQTPSGAAFPSGFNRGINPALGSFSATYPANGTTNSAGFQGDAFRHGYAYATDNDATRTFFQLPKSTVPQLLPSYLNAAGAPYNPAFMIQLINSVIQKRPDVDGAKKLIALVPLAQYDAIWRAGVTLVQPMQPITGEYGKTLDGTPNDTGLADTFSIGGVTCYKDRRQPASQIDFIVPDQVGKCVGAQLQLFKEGTNNGFAPVMNTTTGTPTSTIQMIMFDSWDFGYKDPGMFARIGNLAKPSGY